MDVEQVSVEHEGRELTGIGEMSPELKAHIDGKPAPEAAPETVPSVESKAEPEATKPPRGAKRIDQLTGEREAAKREADQAKQDAADARRDAAEVRARIAALESARAEPVTTKATEPTADSRPKPTEGDIGTKYETYGDFVEDLSDWKAEQRIAAIDFDARIRSRIEADAATRSFQDTLGKVFDRGQKVYGDFDAVLQNGPGVPVTLGKDADEGQARVRYIAGLPNAEHLFYAIAKDATLAQTLARASDLEFGMRLSALAPSSAVASPASTASAVVPLPIPYQPVGSGSSTTVTPSNKLVSGEDYDKSGYREKRRQELARRK